MNRFARCAFLMAVATGCGQNSATVTTDAPAPPAVSAQPPAVAPPAAVGRPVPASAAAPEVDQDKLKEELVALGVGASPFGELRVTPDALTADGDPKPGVAAKLAQLKGATAVQALDLPAFGVGAAKAVASIPGLKQIDLWRTNASDAAIAALGGCPTLERVSLNNGSAEFPAVGDAGLAGLAKLTNLTALECQQGKVTGAGLAAVAGAQKLETLNLNGCKAIDDSAAPHLAKLTALQELNLSGTKVGAGVLETVKALPKLRRLALGDTGVTDTALPALAALPGLTSLEVGGTAVTDAGAAALAKSQSLAWVDVHDTKVTDAGVIALAGLPKLRELTLFRLPLTDASLVALAKAPELTQLWLAGNQFTTDGLAKFKADRPKVRVFE